MSGTTHTGYWKWWCAPWSGLLYTERAFGHTSRYRSCSLRQGRWSARSVMAVEFNGYLATPVWNDGEMAPGEMVGGGDRLV